MAQNELQLVILTQAKRLKAAGFDWIIDSSFFQAGNDFALGIGFGSANWNDREKHRYSAPTVALALKWFRDVKKVYYVQEYCWQDITWDSFIYHEDVGKWKFVSESTAYEEAESALLDALLTELDVSETACK